MPAKLLHLLFPAAGIVKSTGYQSQPPYTAPGADNVFLRETLEQRDRGGSRPGTLKAFAGQLGAGPVRCLATVQWEAAGVVKEAIAAVVSNDLYYAVNGSTIVAVANCFDGSSGHLFAVEGLQKIYFADPAGTNGVAGDGLSTDNILVWDPSNPGSLADLVLTSGSPTAGRPLITNYRNRLVVAGPDENWEMSRVADFSDWNFACGLDDPDRAVSGASTEAGKLGEPITALIQHTDEYMIFGGENSTWLLRGDPTYGGRIDPLSRIVGPVSGSAWCKGPGGETVMLTRDGLYLLGPGGAGPLASFSRERLPAELRDVDPTANTILMAYDTRRRGIHFYITPAASAAGEHWFVDQRNKGFFKWSFGVETHQPTSLARHAYQQDSVREIMLGSKDGYLRKYDDATASDINADDTATAISSSVMIGPVRLGNGYADGMLSELSAILDQQSGDVTWEAWVFETAEEAVIPPTYTTGTVAVAPDAGGSIVTLANGTWPLWASSGTLTVGGTVYTVASRTSDSLIVLDDINVAVAPGAGYTLSHAPFATGTWSGGRSLNDHVRGRGQAAVVKLTATTRWAMESVLAIVDRAGMQRG